MIANTKALENLRVGFLASRADSAAAAPVQVLLLPEFDASHSFLSHVSDRLLYYFLSYLYSDL